MKQRKVQGDRSLGLNYPCFHCSRNLVWVRGSGLHYVELTEDSGIVRRLHGSCVERYLDPDTLSDIEYECDVS